MTEFKETSLPLKKGYLQLLMVLSFAFAIISLFSVAILLQDIDHPTLLISGIILSAIGFLFFGGGGLALLAKVQDTQPGLIINEEGIFENSTFISFGFIPWNDIQEIAELSVRGQPFVLVKLKNPQQYLNKPTSTFNKIFRKLNARFYSSPVQISSNTLPLDHQEVFRLVQEGFQRFQLQSRANH